MHRTHRTKIERIMDVPAFALVAIAYALFGGSLSTFYIYCEHLRKEPPVHVLTVVLTFFATLLAVLALSFDAYTNVLSGGRRRTARLR